ncbi:Cytochrome c oxidase [Sarcoptes scabiei]|nr:Cytochrome c oxidase [Sarcoptes scabiei]
MNRLDLNELDRQLIDCTSNNNKTSISYKQLYDIARSIISIDFDRSQSKSNTEEDHDDSDQEEFVKTLTKILQLCQTIIDFLLADIHRLEIEHKTISNQNNLYIENLKLKKLLQLQQRAIVYRRSKMANSMNVYEHHHHSESFESNADEDSLNNLKDLPYDLANKFECIYCLKRFNDADILKRHLQTKHLSNNEDSSVSISSSIASNLSFVQQLYSQYCKEQMQKISSSNSKSKDAITIRNLKNEIEQLNEKLSKTEIQLEQEKLERKNFESNLRKDFQEQLKSIQDKFESISINKIKKNEIDLSKNDGSLNKIKQNSEIKIYDESVKYRQESRAKHLDSSETSETIEDSRFDNQKKIPSQNEYSSDSKNLNEDSIRSNLTNSIEGNEANENLELKNNLRSELISELNLKRRKKQKQRLKESNRIVSESKQSDDYEKQQRYKENIGTGLDTNRTSNIEIKNEILNSVESKIENFLKDKQKFFNKNILDEEDIKEKTNEIIDRKANKSRENLEIEESKNTANDLSEIEDENREFDSNINTNTTSIETIDSKINNQEDSKIKSKILKSILKNQKSTNENAAKRRITFSNEVTEFQISPLNSDDESNDRYYSSDRSQQKTSDLLGDDIGSSDSDQNHSNERVFVMDDNSSEIEIKSASVIDVRSDSSSDSSDEEQDHGRIEKISIDDDTSIRSNRFENETKMIPIPAKRHNISGNSNTINSSAQISKLDQRHQNDRTSMNSKVQELKELIEKKLQNPIKDGLNYRIQSAMNSKEKNGTLSNSSISKHLPLLDSYDLYEF